MEFKLGWTTKEYEKYQKEHEAAEMQEHEKKIYNKECCECKKQKIVVNDMIPNACPYDLFTKDSCVMKLNAVRSSYMHADTAMPVTSLFWKVTMCRQELLLLGKDVVITAHNSGHTHCIHTKRETYRAYNDCGNVQYACVSKKSLVKHTNQTPDELKDGEYHESPDRKSLRPIEDQYGNRLGWYLLSYDSPDKWGRRNKSELIPSEIKYEILDDNYKKRLFYKRIIYFINHHKGSLLTLLFTGSGLLATYILLKQPNGVF